MVLALLLSSVAAGLIATTVMAFFLYLPRLWNQPAFDVTGALGSAMTAREDQQSRFLGTSVYFAGGVLFAVLYGLVALGLMQAPRDLGVPTWPALGWMPVGIDLLYPLLGALIGFVHGMVVAFVVTVVVIEHHPLPRYRTRIALVPSQVVGHVAYGAAVMFFHHQFLQLLLG